MVVFLALVAGLLWPVIFKPLAGYSSLLLMLIFFTSSLRLSFDELKEYAKDWKMVLLTTFFMLVFMPVAMWLPPKLFAPDWALPFLIVGAMPTGMTIALIAEYFGGKTTLALVITAATSLIAPFTVPLIFQFIIGQNIPLPTLTLFLDLLLTIVVPFAVAMFVQRGAKVFIKKHDKQWSQISVITFGLLIASIVSDTTQGSAITLGWDEIGILVVMLIYLGGITWLGYVMTWWRTAPEKATIALCMIYMNNTLSLFIGNKYFNDETTVPRLVIILMIINLLLPPLRLIAKRAARDKGKKIKPLKLLQPFSLP